VSAMRDVRRWALSRRIDVPDRGMLPVALIEAFNAAHPDDPCPMPKLLRSNFARWGHPDATPDELAEQRRLGGRNRHR